MSAKSDIRYTLTPFGIGSLFSYDVSGEYIIGRLLGLFPVRRFHLASTHYLRLACRSDASYVFLFFNWINFMPHRRSSRPVYILQTRSRYRIFLKLDGATHFRLRQAIARHAVKNMRMAA